MIKAFFYFFILAVALLGVFLIGNALYYTARLAFVAYMRFRGKRVVICPETREYVAVEVDARRAATTAATGDEPQLLLRSCTRWPERADCDQACVWQIERAPEECRVRTMLDEWYAPRACHFCGQEFGRISWTEHKPALLSPDHMIIEWKEIAPERVPAVLTTHRPVCWDCAVAESFRTEHPELVTDRNSKALGSV